MASQNANQHGQLDDYLHRLIAYELTKGDERSRADARSSNAILMASRQKQLTQSAHQSATTGHVQSTAGPFVDHNYNKRGPYQGNNTFKSLNPQVKPVYCENFSQKLSQNLSQN